MERWWVFEQLTVSVARIDFLDPAVASEPDARERGVRVEVRPAASVTVGSIYASATTVVRPALCRLDFLESAPHAADRMHWHPDMADGEPGDRTFDRAMPPDPVGWLTRFLTDDLSGLLAGKGLDVEPLRRDLAQVAGSAVEIGRSVTEGLAWARALWPEVERDDRGMAKDVTG